MHNAVQICLVLVCLLLFSCLHNYKGKRLTRIQKYHLEPSYGDEHLANLGVLPWSKAPQGVSSLHFWKVYPPYSCLTTCKVCNPNLQRVNATPQPFFFGGEFTHSRAMKTYACWNSPTPPSFPPAVAPFVPSPYFLCPSLSR